MLTHAAQPTVVDQDLASSLDVCEVCDWIEKGLQIPAIVQGSEAVHGVHSQLELCIASPV